VAKSTTTVIFDSGASLWQRPRQLTVIHRCALPFQTSLKGFKPAMIKAEWGTKRTCPKCGVRFYDLTKDEPVECIECGNQWTPEPVLKSKQPMPFEEVEKKKDDTDLADDDLDIDVDAVDGDVSPDNDVDLGGDEDLGVAGTEGEPDDI
jgi:uncharacterized protein (TIGR02300 family)